MTENNLQELINRLTNLDLARELGTVEIQLESSEEEEIKSEISSSSGEQQEKIYIYLLGHNFYEYGDNVYYRTFGKWECDDCGRWWYSAYSWVWLSEKELEQGFFYLEGSRKHLRQYCRCGDRGSMLFYSRLDPNGFREGDRVHESNLCQKCLRGDFCI